MEAENDFQSSKKLATKTEKAKYVKKSRELEEKPFELICYSKRRSNYVSEEYAYIKLKTKGKTCYLGCQSKCGASAILKNSKFLVPVGQTHSHDSTTAIDRVNMKTQKSEMVKAVQNDLGKSMLEIFQEKRTDETTDLMSYKECASMMKSARLMHVPAMPKSHQDLADMLLKNNTVNEAYCKLNGTPFLKKILRSGDHFSFIFVNMEVFEAVKNSEETFIDGTFSSSAKSFYQVLQIGSLHMNKVSIKE